MSTQVIRSGQLIGHRYRVERSLSRSESAQTYLCTDLRESDSRVTVRVLPVSSPDDKYLAFLRQRFSALSRIRHPYLGRYLDLGLIEQEQRPFLVTEFVDGVDIFTASTGWTSAKIVHSAVGLCRAMHRLHSDQIVHGDLNASNVMFAKPDTDFESIKLVDYGLGLFSQPRADCLDPAHLAYAAPEILLGRPPGVRSDLYALGVLIYQLLTRRLPFEEDDQGYIVQKHLQGRPDMGQVERIEGGSGLAQVLRDLLEKDTERRPSSAAEVIRLLSAATGRDFTGGIRASVHGFFSQSRFVGRDEEMSFLQERASKVHQSGRGWTVFVVGEAGSGKTRCMEEFRIWALLRGWHIVEGRCLPQESRSYEPYRQVLDSTMPAPGSSTGVPESKQLFQFVADPGMTGKGSEGISAESAAGHYRNLLAREILRRLINAPTMLFLHDFHWADEATTTVLEYLTSDIMSHPILICVSLRPGEVDRNPISSLMTRCGRQLRSETLAMTALSSGSVEELVASMTGDPSIGRKIGSDVHECSGGNPFFAEEVVKHLVDRGHLLREADGWALVEKSLEKLEVPASIAQIFRQRLARLSPSARELAQWLAVFNRAVSADLLRVASSLGESEMTRAIDELLSGQTLQIVSGEGGDCLQFRHALIGEIVRAGLTKIQLQRKHRRIGEAIEARLGPERHYLELATHYTEGNCGEKAISFALKAAAACRAEFANSTALRFYQYVLRHKTALPFEEFCKVAAEASEVYCALGQANIAVNLLSRIVKRKKPAVSKCFRAHILNFLANAYRHLGDLRGSELSAKKGLALLQKATLDATSADLKARLLTRLAFSALLRSKTRQGLRLLHRILHLIPNDDSFLLGQTYALFAQMQRVACNLREARAAAKSAVALIDSTKDPGQEVLARSSMGISLFALGRFELASTEQSRACKISEAMRSFPVRAQTLANLAESLSRMGRMDEAASLCEKAILFSEEAGNPSIKRAILAIKAEMNIHEGRYKSAIDALDSPEFKTRAAPVEYSKGQACYLSAWIAFELGQYDLAVEHLRVLKSCSARSPNLDDELGDVLRACIHYRFGRKTKATQLLLQIEESLTRKHWPYHLCIAKLRLAEISIAKGDAVMAQKSGRDVLRLAAAMPCPQLEGWAHYFLAKAGLLRFETQSPRGIIDLEKAGGSRGDLDAIRVRLSRALEIAGSTKEGELIWRAAADLSQVDEALSDFDSSLANSRRAIDSLRALERQIPESSLSSYRRLPERLRARSECESRLHRIGSEKRERSLDFERLDSEHLRCLFRISGLINSARTLDRLQAIIAEQLLRVTTMDRAFVFLAGEDGRDIRLAARECKKDGSEPAPHERQIISDVFNSGSPLLSMDCVRDDRFSTYFRTGNRIPGAMYCAPLISGAKPLGVLYADHSVPRDNLGESQINLFAAFCNLSAVALENAIARQKLLREKAELQRHLVQASHGYPEIVGRSAVMDRLRERIALAAASPLDVLIVGESGTGKELVARALHRTGRRAGGRFISLDCGALSDNLIEGELFGYRKGAFTGAMENRTGLLESANGGVVFLDEISNLSLKLQGKLLRVLQEREVRRLGETQNRPIDVQVIAATNRNLGEEIRRGRFRKDLYYRLNAMQIQLPPLRDHVEDIPLLLGWFLDAVVQSEGGKSKSFSSDALELLSHYTYPGNVRELRNAVQSSYYSCPTGLIQLEHLPAELKESTPDSLPAGREAAARLLYDRIRDGEANFEEHVKQPFVHRLIGRSIVRQVLRYALLDAGGRYKDAFRFLGVKATQYVGNMNFLKRHGCYLDYREFRGAARSSRM